MACCSVRYWWHAHVGASMPMCLKVQQVGRLGRLSGTRRPLWQGWWRTLGAVGGGWGREFDMARLCRRSLGAQRPSSREGRLPGGGGGGNGCGGQHAWWTKGGAQEGGWQQRGGGMAALG